MSHQLSFPRWLGPIVGTAVGCWLGFSAMEPERAAGWLFPVGGAVLGLLSGCVVYLIDAPSPVECRPATFLGSLFAVLAVLLACIPVVSLAFGVTAFLVNRRVAGWQNQASRLGLGLCIMLTIVVIVAWQVPLK